METNTSSNLKGAEKTNGFLVTGIGASAGGIQALKEFFQHVPSNSGIAYVVILHLSPDHDSQLAHVLQVVSAIPVLQVIKNTKIEPDHIYVVPPNQHLIIYEGYISPSVNLHVEERRAPVDIFFRNLADTHGPRAICVVLSGTGANGSMGLKRIKEMGGVAYVQNPREAEFNEMPRNSIATSLVDEVLPVADIPAKIIAYRNSLGTVEIVADTQKRPESQQQALREIFTLLRVQTGHDFSNYKRATLLRRIERRINIRNLPDLPAYTRYLQQNPGETGALLKDLLISVTNFFRDLKSFEAVEQEVIPAIIKSQNSESQVRIWVAGCATGEEAYSIAMLCAEQTMETLEAAKVQIFATDIDETAIAIAREGYYTLNDAADVSPDRLRRFFNKDGDGYRVRREIREMVLFANHNFLKDPPFSRLHLVTCRNVLIYLNSTAQERVMETFHFALNPGGFLFLGSSESVDGAGDLYGALNREHHIFHAREVLARSYPIPESVPTFQFTKNDQLQKTEEKEARPRNRSSFRELHQKLLEQYAPPSVVINEEYEILHMSEKVGKYFEVSGGEPTQNLLKLIRPELRLDLRSALYQAVQRKTIVEARNIKIGINGQAKAINIHVRPVTQDGDGPKCFILVIFDENEQNEQQEAIMVSSDEPVAKQLEEELIHLKSQLRNSIEHHEFQAEELKASNEELQAMNEELRSTAEELETRKEELQSINEELRTVNQELKVKIDETSVTVNNLQNLINSANVGTIFLDRSFCIRMYTPAVLEIFNLIPSDYGRPIFDITHRLQYEGLLHDAETVLDMLTVVEREVSTADNRSFMMRVLPYRTSEDRINGVVIKFFDITKRKDAEKALQQSEQHLRLLIEGAKDYAIFTLDATRKVLSWSSGAQIIFGYTETEIIGQSGDIIFVPEDREKGDPEKEAQTAAREGRAESERWLLRKDGFRFWGSGVTHPLHGEGGKVIGFVKIKRDLTQMRRLEEAKSFLAAIVETSNDSIITIDFQRNITSWNKAAEDLYGYTAAETIGKNLSMLTLPEDFVAILNKVDAVEHHREVVVFDTVRNKKDGEAIDLEIVMSPVLNTSSEVIGISTIARNVSERKIREANLALLATINLDFAPLLSMHDVMEPVGEQLAVHLRLSRCYFSFVDEETDSLDVVYEYRRDKDLPAITGVHRISNNLTEEGRQHFSAGKLAVMNAATGNPLMKTGADLLKKFGAGSVVDVPHLEGGRWKFLLTVGRSKGGEWRRDELELLQELASKIYMRIERARAEEALRKSEERLQRVLSIETVGIIYFNVEGIIFESNAAFEKMSGLSKEDLIKGTIHWQHLTPPEFMEVSHKAMAELLTQGQSTPFEKQYIRPDGSRWWALFAGRRLSQNEFVEFVVDITPGKKAEEALSQSEIRFRTLANVVPQVIWTNTGDGYADYFNQRWYEYSGLTYEQSECLGWQAIVHPDDAPESVEKWNNALNAGEVFDTEYRLRRHDGGYCWFIGRNVPLKDDAGNVTGWFGSATDIENLKKTEEALSQSEERLRITMESATDYGIITMDTRGRVERWSQGATQLFGYAEAEMISQLADIIFTDEDREVGAPQQEMETARDTGRAADERWHQRKDGSRFFASGVMRPIKNSEPTGYVKILRDMTKQQLFTEELTRLVNERTIELKRSNEDLRQFAHVASHDLKEPVRKVKTFNNRLNDEFGDLLPEKAKTYIKKIDASAARMFSMIEGVLAYSLLGKADKSIAPVDLNKTIDEIESVLEVLIQKKNAAITKTELPTINGNPTLIFQLFYNLILNSLKFSKEDELSHISVSSEVVKQENAEFVQITLSDNGIGFEPEYEQMIFETFARLNPLDEYEGTGLGLALCKKIVERHGGQISATGELGKGAVFTILLPVNLHLFKYH